MLTPKWFGTPVADFLATEAEFPSIIFLFKALFFGYFGFLATYAPFVPLFLSSAGGSKIEIGLISALQPFIGFISMPAIGYVADKIRRHTVLLSFLIIVTSVLRLGILLCSSLLAVATLILSAEFTGNPICSIIDSTVLDSLPDPLLYGQQRLWGTVGWGCLATLAGLAITDTGGPAAALWIHAIGNITVLVIVSRLHVVRPPPAQGSAVAACFTLLRDGQTMAFVLGTVIMGQAYGAIGAFLFLRLQEMGGSPLLMGLTLAVNCAVEAPVFHFSGAVIRRLGLIGVLVLCLSLMSLRLAFYGVLESPWPVLLIEGIHGITFALLWSTGTVPAPAGKPPRLNKDVFLLCACMREGHV
jgi:PPP family 3-phenylpropionic acid transporter